MVENSRGNYDADDGFINAMNFDGTGRKMLLANGVVITGKQLQLDQNAQQLYWCDSEGCKVVSCKTDGTDLLIHIERSRNSEGKVDILEQCVGITLDVANNWFYWTQKGTFKGNFGCLFRSPLVPKSHQNPANRTDIQLLLENVLSQLNYYFVMGYKFFPFF